MATNTTGLRWEVTPGYQLAAQTRQAIIDLCTGAYEEDFTALMTTFQDSVHVLGWLDDQLVTHALWVTRWLQVGATTPLCTAYIEAVATDPAYRNRGFATQAMQRVAAAIQTFELAALSPFSLAWYARLGWEQWRGPLFIRTATGLLPTPEEEGNVMILRLPKTPALDLAASLSAEWRKGELW